MTSGTAAVHGPEVAGVDLEQATIPDLHRAMDAGRLTSAELTAFYLDRIRALNPRLHAVVATNPDARRLAEESDRRRRAGGRLGPLDGIPVLLKDNIDTADRQPTTAGSLALLGARPAADAHLVRRLRAAGAVVLGKANLSEWANFRDRRSSSGWSAVGGQTANPYALDRNTCGSSSGSAAAVAAHLAPVAVGTETNGSIVTAAGATGVVGVKPSTGLVSRHGLVPISGVQDTAGPMARTVTDAAILLGVLSGRDGADPATAHAPERPDYTGFLDPNALRDKRIGVWDPTRGTSPETMVAFARAVALLESAGATAVEVAIPELDAVGRAELPAMTHEFKHGINRYLAATPGDHPPDLAGLIAFNEANAEAEMGHFGQELFEEAQATSGNPGDPEYLRLRAAASGAARRGLDDTLRAHGLDAVAAPTNAPAWRTTLGQGDRYLFGSSTPAAVSGYANATVPMGFVGALPVGLSIMAGRYGEPAVLALAYAFEQVARARRPPGFLPTC
ncbi:amidase [Saccharothrix sp. Mg75]|uniref:amidase n=1 Tax=Saccharothrix sp. Mg75 TaxID=3445357 RepID=UPI003EEB65A5